SGPIPRSRFSGRAKTRSFPSAIRPAPRLPTSRRRIFPPGSGSTPSIAPMSSLLDALRERVLIFDGAMGTQLHGANLSLDDYWGQENNSEVLNLSRPDIVRDVHAKYFEAGADCVETNTFGGNLLVQGEYGQADKVYDINVIGAKLAREAASSFTDRPRWVVGSMGPGRQLPSLGQTKLVSVQPNAGLPEMVQGRAHYNLSPEELVRYHKIFVDEFGVNMVGGCCGTTPDHIEQLVAALRDHPRPDRSATMEPAAASLYI